MTDVSPDELLISEEKAIALRKKFPDKYPVVVHKVGDGIDLTRRKYLASNSSSMGELIFSIRKYVSLKDHEAMFLYTKNGLVPTSALVSTIWDKLNERGCLYLEVHKENTFG